MNTQATSTSTSTTSASSNGPYYGRNTHSKGKNHLYYGHFGHSKGKSVIVCVNGLAIVRVNIVVGHSMGRSES